MLDETRQNTNEKAIGILGPLGTFTEGAAKKYCDKTNTLGKLIPYNTITDVFVAVKKGEVEEGVVPIENLLHGHVIETLDNLYKNGVKIKNAVILPITHYLVSLPETVDVKKIISHIQALSQCSNYLNKNYPGVPREQTQSTAAAMKHIKDNNLSGMAAIGTKIGAEKYWLKILAEDIGNNKKNKTMFIVLNHKGAEKTGNDRTSIVISPNEDRPGLLKDILESFSTNGINLEMIQSRPDGKGNYIFYLDLVGHPEDEKTKKAFDELEAKLGDLDNIIKILGSYPRVTLSE